MKNTSKVQATQRVAAIPRIAGGSFQMGKDLGTAAIEDETPVHTVTLSSFSIGMPMTSFTCLYRDIGNT